MSKTITAKYDSVCPACDSKIVAGTTQLARRAEHGSRWVCCMADAPAPMTREERRAAEVEKNKQRPESREGYDGAHTASLRVRHILIDIAEGKLVDEAELREAAAIVANLNTMVER